MQMILSQGQAFAIKEAMTALNNINGKVTTEFKTIQVSEVSDGRIFVVNDADNAEEQYPNQDAFFSAYKV